MLKITVAFMIWVVSYSAVALTCLSTGSEVARHSISPIVSCGKISGPSLPPSSSFSNAVFVSCNAESTYGGGNLPTCRSIALGIIEFDAGVTLNLMVKAVAPVQSKDLEVVLSEIKQAAAQKDIRLNILSTTTLPGDFARDASTIILRPFSPAQIATLPDMMGGARAMREAVGLCSDLSVGDAYFPSKTGYPFLRRDQIPPADVAKLYDFDPNTGRTQVELARLQPLQIEGGNIIGLPDGVLAVGTNQQRQPPQQVMEYFSGQNLVQIPVSDLLVGHIDEIVNLVPNKNKICGFAVLIASPRALKNWIKGAGQETQIFGSISPEPRLWKDIDRGSSMNWHALEQVLNKMQQKIDVTQDALWQTLKKKTTCSKYEIFVEVPMGWRTFEDARPLFQNPVNGLHLNGRYLMSKLIAEEGGVPMIELEEYIGNLIIANTGIQIVKAVDTTFSDDLHFGRGGNVHCGTLNVPICDLSP